TMHISGHRQATWPVATTTTCSMGRPQAMHLVPALTLRRIAAPPSSPQDLPGEALHLSPPQFPLVPAAVHLVRRHGAGLDALQAPQCPAKFGHAPDIPQRRRHSSTPAVAASTSTLTARGQNPHRRCRQISHAPMPKQKMAIARPSSQVDDPALSRLTLEPGEEPLPVDADLVAPPARQEHGRDLPRPRQLPDPLIAEPREPGGLPDADQHGLAGHQAATTLRAPWRWRTFSWCLRAYSVRSTPCARARAAKYVSSAV